MSDTPNLLDPAAVAAAMMADVPKPSPAEPAPAKPTEPAPAVASAVQPEAPASDTPRDDGGNSFRPGFHRENPDGSPFRNRFGRFMPRGGRHKRSAPESAGGTAPAPANPPPAKSAWSEAERAEASAPPVAEQPAGESAGAAAQPAPAPEVADHSEDAAEVVCLAVYTSTGLLFDAPEDCEPKPAEHTAIRRAVAAYVRAKGWRITGGWGIVVMFAAYLIRVLRKPGPSKKFRSWISDQRAARAKPVAPVPPEASEPTATTAARQAPIAATLDNLSERPAS